MIDAAQTQTKSKASVDKELDAYTRSDIRNMTLKTVFITACLAVVSTNQVIRWYGGNAPQKVAYEQGVKCASAAAAQAFQIKNFSKDQIAQQIYQSALRDCMAQGPK